MSEFEFIMPRCVDESCARVRRRLSLRSDEKTGTPGGIARAASRPGVLGRSAPSERTPFPSHTDALRAGHRCTSYDLLPDRSQIALRFEA